MSSSTRARATHCVMPGTLSIACAPHKRIGQQTFHHLPRRLCVHVTSALVILFSATYMVWHNTTENNPTMCKAGALLFLLWSVLHLWVGFEGAQKYFYHTTEETMQGLIGGDRVPFRYSSCRRSTRPL